MFSDISSDSAEYINYMIDHEMFDINDRAHKRSDIFSCCMQPFIKKPFIIGCFHGNGLEVNSLIHEFDMVMHFILLLIAKLYGNIIVQLLQSMKCIPNQWNILHIHIWINYLATANENMFLIIYFILLTTFHIDVL